MKKKHLNRKQEENIQIHRKWSRRNNHKRYRNKKIL